LSSDQLNALCDDLEAECEDLDGLVARLPAEAWELPTPAVGWSITDQIHHLAFFDGRGVLAVEDPEAFVAWRDAIAVDPAEFEQRQAKAARLESDGLLAAWRAGRQRLLATFRSIDPSARVPWHGPPMAAASFVTARLMETWAHGTDVADTLGVFREPTTRLRHIARLGVRTLPYSYLIHGKATPDREVRVELRAPDGSAWAWGPEAASDRLEGPALDFCLVVTQRRNIADTDLVATGRVATEWVSIAQAFAGPPGSGRPPRGANEGAAP